MIKVLVLIFLASVSFASASYEQEKIVKDLMENLNKQTIQDPFFIKKYIHHKVKQIHMIFDKPQVKRGIYEVKEFITFLFNKTKNASFYVKEIYSTEKNVIVEAVFKGMFKNHKNFINQSVAIIKFKHNKIKKVTILVKQTID